MVVNLDIVVWHLVFINVIHTAQLLNSHLSNIIITTFGLIENELDVVIFNLEPRSRPDIVELIDKLSNVLLFFVSLLFVVVVVHCLLL